MNVKWCMQESNLIHHTPAMLYENVPTVNYGLESCVMNGHTFTLLTAFVTLQNLLQNFLYIAQDTLA